MAPKQAVRRGVCGLLHDDGQGLDSTHSPRFATTYDSLVAGEIDREDRDDWVSVASL